METKTSRSILERVKAAKDKLEKEARDPTAEAFSTALQGMAAEQLRSDALKDVRNVGLTALGAGVAGRGLIGLIQSLRENKAKKTRSGPSYLPLPYPTKTAELKEEIVPALAGASGSYLGSLPGTVGGGAAGAVGGGFIGSMVGRLRSKGLPAQNRFNKVIAGLAIGHLLGGQVGALTGGTATGNLAGNRSKALAQKSFEQSKTASAVGNILTNTGHKTVADVADTGSTLGNLAGTSTGMGVGGGSGALAGFYGTKGLDRIVDKKINAIPDLSANLGSMLERIAKLSKGRHANNLQGFASSLKNTPKINSRFGPVVHVAGAGLGALLGSGAGQVVGGTVGDVVGSRLGKRVGSKFLEQNKQAGLADNETLGDIGVGAGTGVGALVGGHYLGTASRFPVGAIEDVLQRKYNPEIPFTGFRSGSGKAKLGLIAGRLAQKLMHPVGATAAGGYIGGSMANSNVKDILGRTKQSGFLEGDEASSKGGIPWYGPAMLLGGLGGLGAGWAGMDKLLDVEQKRRRKTEMDEARQQFHDALMSQYSSPIATHPELNKKSADETMVKVGEALSGLFSSFQKALFEKAALDWENLAGKATGGYGMYAGLSGLLTGAYVYDKIQKRSRRAILEKALQKRQRRNSMQAPTEIYAVPEGVPVETGV